MTTPHYEDELVTLYLGDCRELLPTLDAVDHVITDPPYSDHVHRSVRSNGRHSKSVIGRRKTADDRRNYDLGFAHLDEGLRRFCAVEFARLVRRWSLVFSDVESAHLWRTDLEDAGLKYVRTGIWHKQGSTPQFSGDRPANAVEAITVNHGPGRTKWNGGGASRILVCPHRPRTRQEQRGASPHHTEAALAHGRADRRLHGPRRTHPRPLRRVRDNGVGMCKRGPAVRRD